MVATRFPRRIALALALGGAVFAAGAASAQELTKLRFGTNWLAQAEHGGFYQAVADGTYENMASTSRSCRAARRPTIRLLLPAGKIDFYMGGNMIQAFSAVQEGCRSSPSPRCSRRSRRS